MLQAKFGDAEAAGPQQQKQDGSGDKPERAFDHIWVVARILGEGKGGDGGIGGFTPPNPVEYLGQCESKF